MVSKLRNLWPRDNRLSRTDSRKYQAPEHVEKRDTQGIRPVCPVCRPIPLDLQFTIACLQNLGTEALKPTYEKFRVRLQSFSAQVEGSDRSL